MDFDKDQQALAWQQIIRNKAFDNVRVQRGESWVDAACRTLDELVDQKESFDKKFAKLMSDYQDIEDERDEWKDRADKWQKIAQVRDEPDHRPSDDAATNDGPVISWGLADVAFEQRTANMIAFYNQIDKPHDQSSQELHEMIVQRLGLRGL